MNTEKEALYDLLFEVSNADRHNILRYLETNHANLTSIARETELNLPETRRHVTRLAEVDLIERTPDGSYTITSFGERVLEQLDDISFFLQNRNYFHSHTLEKLPHEFKIRLGDLSASQFHENMLGFLQTIEQIVTRANEELHILTARAHRVGFVKWYAARIGIQA